jgi:hypothetical protein
MEKTKKFIAQFTDSVQYTQDSWKSITPSLGVTEQTTIGEIREWMKKRSAEMVSEFKVIILD